MAQPNVDRRSVLAGGLAGLGLALLPASFQDAAAQSVAPATKQTLLKTNLARPSADDPVFQDSVHKKALTDSAQKMAIVLGQGFDERMVTILHKMLERERLVLGQHYTVETSPIPAGLGRVYMNGKVLMNEETGQPLQFRPAEVGIAISRIRQEISSGTRVTASLTADHN